MAHSGFGRRTNHTGQFSKLSPIGDSRRTMGDIALARLTSRPWTAGENDAGTSRGLRALARFRLNVMFVHGQKLYS